MSHFSEDEDYSSESVEEDEGAKFLTEGVQDKFLEIFPMLCVKDPIIYDSKTKFFQSAEDDEVEDKTVPEDAQKEERKKEKKEKKDKKKEKKDKKQEKKDKKEKKKDKKAKKERKEEKKAKKRSSDEDGKQSRSKRKLKMTVNDLLIRSAGISDSESDGEAQRAQDNEPSIAEQREQAKLEFAKAAAFADASDDDTDNLLLIKTPVASNASSANSLRSKLINEHKGADEKVQRLQDFWLNSSKMSESDRFLRDYVINERWKPSAEQGKAQTVSVEQLPPVDDEEDAEELQKMEEYEEDFAFRHQHPDAICIPSHPRNVSTSLRKVSTKRKDQRERRKARDEEAKKQAATENIKTKQKLRQQIDAELQEALSTEATTVGNGEESSVGSSIPRTFRELVEVSKQRIARPEETEDTVPEQERLNRWTRMLDRYYQVDCEDVLPDGTQCRFKYTKVEPDSGGLTIDEIFDLDDAELNRFAPLKYFAPYRSGPPMRKKKFKPWLVSNGGKFAHLPETVDLIEDTVTQGDLVEEEQPKKRPIKRQRK